MLKIREMNKIKLFFLVGISIIICSCQSQDEKRGQFEVLPTPQQFEITGVSKLHYNDLRFYYSPDKFKLPSCNNIMQGLQPTEEEAKAQITGKIDTSLDVGAEGYVFTISEKKITITGKDKAGLFYGFMTLGQLMEDAKEQDVPLPLCTVKDAPVLSYRAVHLDIKHHINKISYYYNLLDKLASYKVNAIIVELEDKIKYKRQPVIGCADAFSIEEWKKLSDYAWERHIEISPLVQGLGHASFILKHDEYKDLRDDPNSDWAFNPLDPKTYEVQYDLYMDAMEATPHGKYLHVGGDEVFTTGRGSGKSALDLQLIWLNKVCGFAEEHGRIPIFWDDMPLEYANVYAAMYDTTLTKGEVDKLWEKNEHKLQEFLGHFPKNCIYMRWNYNTPGTWGNRKAMQWFSENGMQVMGATAGQITWILMPQDESNINSIKSFTEISIESNHKGLLLTLWDDESPHFELYNRGIVAFAEYVWAGAGKSKEEVKKVYRHREFSAKLSPEQYGFIDDLEEPVCFWKNALLKGDKRKQRNVLSKSGNPYDELIDLPGKTPKGEWSRQYSDRLEKAAHYMEVCENIKMKIGEMKQLASRNQYTLEVYEQVNELTKFTLGMLLTLKEYDNAPAGSRQEQEALNKVKQLPVDFKAVRAKLEEVYGETRVVNKPADYILDQDYAIHLANQAISFDWQFLPEILLLERIEEEFKL